MPDANRPLPIVKIVGMSAAGKSTLVAGLRLAGFDARPVSQEHSNVRDLWRQFEFPRMLVFLDVALATQRTRRTDVTWSAEAHAEEARRLQDARDNADLAINTTSLSRGAVLEIVLAWLRAQGIRSADEALPPVGATGAPI